MNNINFSVTMPTFNQSSLIRRSIQSLLAHTYDKWELIIVNDGSTDDTENNISDFLKDSRIIHLEFMWKYVK